VSYTFIFLQGYYRAALSMKELLLFEEAAETLVKGLKVEGNNKDLKGLQIEVSKELKQMQQVLSTKSVSPSLTASF
jgi:hypothetical protein